MVIQKLFRSEVLQASVSQGKNSQKQSSASRVFLQEDR